MSLYIDDYFLGRSLIKGNRFTRILRKGYNEDHFTEYSVKLNEKKSTLIEEAVINKDFVRGVGKRDQEEFLIIPIGNYSTICLSVVAKENLYKLNEFNSVVNLSKDLFQLVENQITAIGIQKDLSLSSLKASYGDLEENCQIGSFFIDICDYSKKSRQFGIGYEVFIGNNLFPDLVKKVNHIALPERIIGDEILLISTSHTSGNENVLEAFFESIKLVIEYLNTEGNEKSKNKGFDRLLFKGGFAFGEGVLIIDGISGRTLGRPSIDGARLIDAAKPGEILTNLDKHLVEEKLPEYYVEERVIQVKEGNYSATVIKVSM